MALGQKIERNTFIRLITCKGENKKSDLTLAVCKLLCDYYENTKKCVKQNFKQN